MTCFGLAIFCGAFLLFSVQPLLAKYILPWFGGQAGVWVTALLFFQVLLLAGYAYAHLLTRWFRIRGQVLIHSTLLLAALALLPITPSAGWKPSGGEDPGARILLLLLSSIGLPGLVLAASSPLLQSWFGKFRPGASPYRLYALSNAASLLALASYPFVIEPSLGRSVQAVAWSWGFGVFALCVACCGWIMWRTRAAPAEVPEQPSATHPGPAVRALWVALPTAASVLLFAVTNQITQDVAAVPFLWVLPLGLYLLSFILVFSGEAFYRRPLWLGLLVPALVVLLWVMSLGVDVGLFVQLVGYLTALFVVCMAAHGELARLKPAPRQLTGYYLAIASGGALGGVSVGLLAPKLFNSVLELPLGLLFAVGTVLLALLRDPRSRLYQGRPIWAWGILLAGLGGLAVALVLQFHRSQAGVMLKRRSFYGVLSVLWQNRSRREDSYLTLRNGATDHGTQFIEPRRRGLPTTYYGPGSGLGIALNTFPQQPGRRIGMIGLGTGTIAAYGRPGDYIRVYEINPDVLRIAQQHFSYLQDTEADVALVLGDARLSLEREAPQAFDILAVDAFSSDAVPVHLLTVEAFEVYFRHLKPDGILAIHTTNRHFLLAPVVTAAAEYLRWPSFRIDNDDGPDGVWNSEWMIVTRNQVFLADSTVAKLAREWRMREAEAPVRLWTDDYASLVHALVF